MPVISNIISSIVGSEPKLAPFEGGGRVRELEVKRVAQARRMKLWVEPGSGAVRLTLPPRASLRRALAWVEERRDWVEAELARLSPPELIAPGGHVPLEGQLHLIDWQPTASRTIQRETGRLVLGGPIESVEARLLRWLRAYALEVLTRETLEIAAKEDIVIRKVSVGDPRRRWGSCASSGDIRYSWRLILAPPEVRRATVAHEVAHRLHMDHSPAFHAAAARLFGREPTAERNWLKRHGAALHRWGRD